MTAATPTSGENSRASSGGSIDVKRLFVVLAALFCAVKLLLLTVYAWNARFVMDEFNLTSSGLLIAEGFYTVVDPIKTILQVYFYELARLVTDNSVELMHVARLQSLVLVLGMVALVYALTRHLGGRKTEALFALCVLLAFSTFMERSFRIRSEPLAVLLPLLALWFSTRERSRGLTTALLAGVLVGVSFLTTQKSIYYAAVFGLGYLMLWLRRREARWLLSALVFAVGWSLSLLAYAVAFGGTGFAQVLNMVFTSPIQAALYADDYYTFLGDYVVQTLVTNQVPWAMCLIGLVLAAIRFRDLEDRQLFALSVTAGITVLIFLHNQPWPYLFVMVIPFLAPWSLFTVQWLAGGNGRRLHGLQLGLMAFLAFSFIRNFVWMDVTNVDQTLVMARAESLLAPDDRYADGVGMLPTRRWAGNQWVWDAMNANLLQAAAARGDLTEIEAIFDDQPKVWIYNYRVRAMWEVLLPYLENAYLPVDPNIFLAGVEVSPGQERDFTARWQGPYRLYARDGSPLESGWTLDGTEVRGEVFVGLGQHRVGLSPLSAPGGALVLPAGLRLPGGLPARGKPRELFAWVYN